MCTQVPSLTHSLVHIAPLSHLFLRSLFSSLLHERMLWRLLCSARLAAPLRSSDSDAMPRVFDLFGQMSQSSAGGVVELRKIFVCFGYMYSFDLSKWSEDSTLRALVKPSQCTIVGVHIKCFGTGFANKSVESMGLRGRVQAEDGLPLVSVPMETAHVMRVRRISGVTLCALLLVRSSARVLFCSCALLLMRSSARALFCSYTSSCSNGAQVSESSRPLQVVHG